MECCNKFVIIIIIIMYDIYKYGTGMDNLKRFSHILEFKLINSISI